MFTPAPKFATVSLVVAADYFDKMTTTNTLMLGTISNGAKQGGVLYPVLLNLYLDQLIS